MLKIKNFVDLKELAKNYNFTYCEDWSIPYEDDNYDINGKQYKASFNIDDIIEKGDYINGVLVNDIVNGKPFHEDYNDPFYSFGWDKEDIKSIVTHEQMEQMSYKLGE